MGPLRHWKHHHRHPARTGETQTVVAVRRRSSSHDRRSVRTINITVENSPRKRPELPADRAAFPQWPAAKQAAGHLFGRRIFRPQITPASSAFASRRFLITREYVDVSSGASVAVTCSSTSNSGSSASARANRTLACSSGTASPTRTVSADGASSTSSARMSHAP